MTTGRGQLQEADARETDAREYEHLKNAKMMIIQSKA